MSEKGCASGGEHERYKKELHRVRKEELVALGRKGCGRKLT